MAKVHGRYLCGGRTSESNTDATTNELLYRFEFPERPGALKLFLDTLSRSCGWNVSLFHYRYHGADIGRVLVGVQVKEEQMKDWELFLKDLGYSYHEENSNRVYRQFLK
jgi:threonine dehydratase